MTSIRDKYHQLNGIFFQDGGISYPTHTKTPWKILGVCVLIALDSNSYETQASNWCFKTCSLVWIARCTVKTQKNANAKT